MMRQIVEITDSQGNDGIADVEAIYDINSERCNRTEATAATIRLPNGGYAGIAIEPDMIHPVH